MPPEVSFDAEAPGFKRLFYIDVDKVERATAELQKLLARTDNAILIANDLKSFFATYLSKPDASAFVSALMTFVRVQDKYSIETDVLIGGLRNLVEKENLLGDKTKADKLFSVLVTLLNNEIICEIYRGSELYFEIDDKLTEARIFTETRPVFTRDAEKIKGYIVRNVLRLEFEQSDEPKAMAVSLSAAQIENLLKQLERAKRKTEILSRTLKQLSPRVVIQGEDYDAS
jgi:hypothetical protein